MFTPDKPLVPLPERPLGGFGWLVAIAGLFNFVSFPLVRGAANEEGGWVFVAVTVGALAAEVALATIWLVWGPGSFLRRLVVHWSVGFGLYFAWAFGFALAFSSEMAAGEVPKAWGTVLCSLPIVSLAAQLPLWPLRTHFGWRIELPPRDAPLEPAQSLSIRDIILGTVVTSVSLAALRLMPQWNQGGMDAGYWTAWAIAVACIAGASALVLLPAVFLVFRISDLSAATGALCGYGVAAWLATILIASAFAGSPPAEAVFAIAFCYASFTATLAMPLLIARSRGCELTLARERERRGTDL